MNDQYEGTLYIVRGLPGSGKSTFCRNILNVEPFEADSYFIKDGVYHFVPTELFNAHNHCFNAVEKAMIEKKCRIAVANTFVKKQEYAKYLILAKMYGYNVQIFICNNEYKSIHNVPEHTIMRMKENFEI